MPKTFTRGYTAMRRAVIDDPEDAISGTVRLPLHHVRYEPLEWLRSIGQVAAPEHLRLMNVERPVAARRR